MVRKKNEHVSISFHYLCREEMQDDEKAVVAITQAEFDEIFTSLNALKGANLKDKHIVAEIRGGLRLAIERIEKSDDGRLITGRYFGSYWCKAPLLCTNLC